MADEKIEEITPGAGGGGGMGAMLPAIVVIVAMPLLSFALTKFVFIPQIQGAVAKTVADATGAEIGETGADGKDSSGKKDDGHGKAAKDDGKKGKDDGHGGGKDKKAADAGPTGNTYEFDGILANVSGSSVNRYVQISFTLEGPDDEFAAYIDKNRVKIIDATISVLSSLSSLELQSPGIKNQVRSRLIASYDAVLKQRIVEGLYFTEFFVQ